MTFRRIGRLVVLLLLALGCRSASARPCWLSPSGDDRNDGGRETPWRTLSHAARQLGAGDTLLLEPGRYAGCLELLSPPRQHSGEHTIRFLAMEDGVVITGGTASNGEYCGIYLRDCAGVEVDGIRFELPERGYWMVLDRVTESTFSNLEFSGGGDPVRWRMRAASGNRFDGIAGRRGRDGAAALEMAACRDNRFEALVLAGGGVALDGDCGETEFFNCVFRDCGDAIVRTGAQRIAVERTLFQDAPPAALLASGEPGVFFRRNLVWGSVSRWRMSGRTGATIGWCTLPADAETIAAEVGCGNLWYDPESPPAGFRNAADGDFQLTPGSAAVDAGPPAGRTLTAGGGRRLPLTAMELFRPGDFVWIGRNRQPAMVVERDETGGLLVVDREAVWEADDAVTLPFHGEAPDFGAYECGLGPTGPCIAQHVPAQRQWRRFWFRHGGRAGGGPRFGSRPPGR